MTQDDRRLEGLCGALLFAGFGLVCEIVFTGAFAAWSGSFKGHVSLLMIPVYMFAYAIGRPLLAALARAGRDRLAVRIPLTVVLIYAIEWIAGALYHAIGLDPWRYEHGWASDFSDGNITLYWLPAWIVFAWIVAPVVRVIAEISPRVVSAVRGLRGPSPGC